MNIENVEFKVIEDQRVVVATIKGIEWDAVEVFNAKFMAHSTSSLGLSACYNQKFVMPHSLKAVAKCAIGDIFDPEKGMKIALKKLAEKYNYSLDKRVLNIYKSLNKCLDKTDAYLVKHKMI